MSAPEATASDPPPAPRKQQHPGWLRGFWSLFVVQFQGAFSDNLFKFLVIFFIGSSAHQLPEVVAGTTSAEQVRDWYVSLILAMFALPFILFSMTGGFMADRYPKRRVVIGTKMFEVLVMTLGTVALWLQSIPFLIGIIFLMSVQSAFFSPSKYGLMPEMLPEEKLSWGNGILGLGTFVAIITGGVLAGVLSDNLGDQRYLAGFLLMGLAGCGLLATAGILKLPAANPGKVYRLNFLSEVWKNLRIARRDRVLFLAMWGGVYFWFLGALFGEPTILTYGQEILDLNDTRISYLRACLAIGIGGGSALAGFLSGRKIEYGLVPLGALGLTIFAALLAIPGLTFKPVAILLVCLGVSGGFYIVPITALIQHRPDKGEKGSIIATEGWLTFVGILAASGIFWLLKTALDLDPPQIFAVGSVATLAGTLYALKLVPDSFMRLVIWILTHTFYRVRVQGRNFIPDKGGALFVCNHLSLADPFFLIASTDRHIRFIMYRGMYEKWWIKPFARMLRVIPISSELRPREMIQALNEASEWIQAGNVVCIFAEGQITRIGQMLPFRKGFQKIMKGIEAPIVPVHLDNVWGSIFSFEGGRFYWKLPHEIPYPVTVTYGEPMPPDSRPVEVRKTVQELGAAAWEERKHRLEPLHRAFLSTVRSRPFRFFGADSTSGGINFVSALAKTVYLGRRLRRTWNGQENVGILLPPSVPGALVNLAALLMGKVPVNLNYTLSSEGIKSCIEQCGIKNVVSSKKFLGHLKLELPVPAVLLEEVAGKPGLFEKVQAAAAAWIIPVPLIGRLFTALPEKLLGRASKGRLDDPGTIIFSSGSTGQPKGVMLSHYNLVSNIRQLGQVFALTENDRFLGVLPFFHSFGFTGTLGAPAVLGVGAAYHANPLDAKTVGQLVQQHKLTFLIATPTFLQIYLRGCQPEQFGSLQFVMVGAEKLPERLASAFEDKFGIRPVEGYGCTECSPVVTVNTRDFRAAGLRQVGAKRGSIGHPLPGIVAKIVDPDTGNELPSGEAGLMLVRGPNIMTGYLNQPEKTAEVLKPGGWYVTGDIAALDEDGFIAITDRLSRFSKIGGEMVPHIKVEEQLHELAGTTEQSFVVTGVPDEKKGERLAVLHNLEDQRLAEVLEKLSQADLPNLWKPRRDQFLKVEEFPHLGTGKLDLKKVKQMAVELGG